MALLGPGRMVLVGSVGPREGNWYWLVLLDLAVVWQEVPVVVACCPVLSGRLKGSALLDRNHSGFLDSPLSLSLQCHI